MSEKYAFDRPLIILAAPRSGSTLLFETLARSNDLWTIGGESHGIFESINRFHPLMGYCDSNALTANDATPQLIEQIRSSFMSELRNANGMSYVPLPGTDETRPRLLEKTPKNALRTSLLDAIFPDALYVYLYRNPRDNISSIMDAWNSGRFITYPSLRGRNGPWSMLLPPGWDAYNHASPEQIAVFQWRAANTAILDSLVTLDRRRWIAVSYEQQVRDTAATVAQICDFAGIPSEGVIASLPSDQPLSRYTLTAPHAGKWQKNADALREILPEVKETLKYIQTVATELPAAEFDISLDDAPSEIPAADSPCHCGSGRLFRSCHGLENPQRVDS